MSAISTYFPNMRVRADLNQPPTSSAAETWTDWSSLVVERLTTFRGGRHELDKPKPGRLSMTLSTPNRDFDPANTSSSFVSAGWKPTRTYIQVQAEVNAAFLDVWYGWVDGWPISSGSNYTKVKITASDALRYLANARLPRSAWDYEIFTHADADNWYRFDETRGKELIDHLDDADGTYQIKDVDTSSNIDSAQHRKFKAEPMIPYAPDHEGYDIGAHNKRLGFAGVARTRVGSATSAPVTSADWSVCIWVRSYPWPASPEDPPDGLQQPVWVQDPAGNAYELKHAGLYITNAGDFVATYKHTDGGPLKTKGFTTGRLGWNGEPHCVWVIKQSDDLRLHINANVDEILVAGISTGATATGNILVGGYYVPGGSPDPPWFIGSVSDMVIFDGVALSTTQCRDLFFAGQHGIFGKASEIQATDVVIGYVLDVAGWPSGHRDLVAGAWDASAIPFNRTKVLDYLTPIVASEYGGRLFVANDGDIRFRRVNQSVTPDETVSNEPTASELLLDGISYGIIDKDVYNDVRVQFLNGETHKVDGTSVNADGQRELGVQTGLTTTADARARRDLLLTRYATTPAIRVQYVDVMPRDADDFERVLGLEIGDRLDVEVTHATGSDLDELTVIEGIEHRVGPGKVWRTRFYLSPHYVYTVPA